MKLGKIVKKYLQAIVKCRYCPGCFCNKLILPNQQESNAGEALSDQVEHDGSNVVILGNEASDDAWYAQHHLGIEHVELSREVGQGDEQDEGALFKK